MPAATPLCGPTWLLQPTTVATQGMASAVTQTVTFNDVTHRRSPTAKACMNGEICTQEEQGGLFDFALSSPERSRIDLEVEDALQRVPRYELVGDHRRIRPRPMRSATIAPQRRLRPSSRWRVLGWPELRPPWCSKVRPSMERLSPSYRVASTSWRASSIRPCSIEVEVQNADGTGGFIWNADYKRAFNWQEWQALGRGYKKDCAQVLAGTRRMDVRGNTS